MTEGETGDRAGSAGHGRGPLVTWIACTIAVVPPMLIVLNTTMLLDLGFEPAIWAAVGLGAAVGIVITRFRPALLDGLGAFSLLSTLGFVGLATLLAPEALAASGVEGAWLLTADATLTYVAAALVAAVLSYRDGIYGPL